MASVLIFDEDLKKIGMIDAYTSLIWAERYWTVGDCELYLPATAENFDLLKIGRFLKKSDSEMLCQIRRIEATTDAEAGNYLAVAGYDVKSWLDQRIVWLTMSTSGNAEAFAREIVDGALGDTDGARQMKNSDGDRIFFLAPAQGFTEGLTEQVSYKNVGEKIREYCKKFGWGYKCYLNGAAVMFSFYSGADRSAEVVFSSEFENLATSKFTEDQTNMGNVALIAGEGEGAARAKETAGEAEGLERFEVYVDAKDISKTITFEELKELYPPEPDGTAYISGDAEIGFTYVVGILDVQIVDDAQLASLEAEYPDGVIITVDGIRCYRIQDVAVADLDSGAPDDADDVRLRDVIYTVYLLTRGYEKLAAFGAKTDFDGKIEPNSTFKLGADYFLGDIVTVRSDLGVTVKARITEIIDVEDDNGHSVEPTFEYIL